MRTVLTVLYRKKKLFRFLFCFVYNQKLVKNKGEKILLPDIILFQTMKTKH